MGCILLFYELEYAWEYAFFHCVRNACKNVCLFPLLIHKFAMQKEMETNVTRHNCYSRHPYTYTLTKNHIKAIIIYAFKWGKGGKGFNLNYFLHRKTMNLIYLEQIIEPAFYIHYKYIYFFLLNISYIIILCNSQIRIEWLRARVELV